MQPQPQGWLPGGGAGGLEDGEAAHFPVAPTRRRGGSLAAGAAAGSQGASRPKAPEPPAEAEEHEHVPYHSGTEPEGEPTLHHRHHDGVEARLLGRESDVSHSSGSASGRARGSGSRASGSRRKPLVVPGVTPLTWFGLVGSSVAGFIQWFAQLEEQYGTRLLWLLFAAQHLLKGVVQQFQASAVMWILMEYNISGPQMQVYTSIAASSWALKPIIGAVSDIFPMCGYRKAPYVIITSLLGVACSMVIGLSTRDTSRVSTIVACLFGMSLQAATCDLLTEAKYSQHIHENPAFGPDLITYVWGGINVGNMVAIGVVGWIITNLGPRAVFLACLVPTAAVLVPTLANYFEEQPMTWDMVRRARAEFMMQGEVVFLCVLMTVMTIFLSIIGGVTDSHETHALSALCVMVVLLPAFHVVLRPEIAKMNTFFVLQACMSLSIGGATFYFYTDKQDEYPEGPHFSPSFFATTLGLVGAFMSLVGLAIYTHHMKDWSYRSLILVSNVLVTILSLLDVVMFRRWNLKLGIPDDWFVMGSSVFTVVIRQWQWMPGVVVLSQLCPQGMEATMFALLAGCSNIGTSCSDYIGAYMLARLGVHPSGALRETKEFKNLWVASAVATMLPAVTIALIPILIPNAKQTDKLLLENTSSATAGSLLSRWRGRDDAERAV